jgi:FkbM family methyltransferase
MSSQYGQDCFVMEVLGGMRNGFFLDSGAADGVDASNTYLLESTFGWKGICVEPNASLFAQLQINRRCACLNCCLYDRDGSVDFLDNAEMIGGILDEFPPARLQYVMTVCHSLSRRNPQPMSVSKAARTLRSVLREFAAPPIIDYWSLDTEGSEFTILRSFPFQEYSFRVITVEHNWFPVRYQIKELLEEHGYRFMRTLGPDDCYVHEQSILPRPWHRYSSRRHGKKLPPTQ